MKILIQIINYIKNLIYKDEKENVLKIEDVLDEEKIYSDYLIEAIEEDEIIHEEEIEEYINQNNYKTMVLRRGDVGDLVKILQSKLGITADGVFGPNTERHVIEFQRKNNLTVDGIVGRQTWETLGLDTDQLNIIITHPDCLIDNGKYETDDGLTIHKHHLDRNEYVTEYGKVDVKGFFIHHTAGWDNPFNQVDIWNTDDRGRISTQYVIGGTNIRGNHKYDGDVVECFPDGYLGWHLGLGRTNIHIHSGGVELCNFGYLYEKDGDFYPWVAKVNNKWRHNYHIYKVDPEFVCDLGYNFRGHRYYHSYSDNQIESLRLLILHVRKIYPNIDFNNGIIKMLKDGVDPKIAFEYNDKATKEFGFWSHTNVARSGKWDCYPHPKLVEMLKTI